VGVDYCGRYGNWDHAWTDEAFMSGEDTAAKVVDELGLPVQADAERQTG
jgi:hypothetical protein